MKKLFLLFAVVVIILLSVFAFSSKTVFADGMMIESDPYSGRWDYSDESNQQAFINYENGLQKMIISVGFENENNNGAVWLFPVPSDPNKIAINIIKNLPQLTGEEISEKAKSNLDQASEYLQMSQIYTIPLIIFTKDMMSAASDSLALGGGFSLGWGENTEQDVEVFEHLEKEGISSEIITAKTANGLYEYFKSKGLKIEKDSIPVLNNYIGKDYSFIASWISAPKKNISAQEIKNNLDEYFSYSNPNQKFNELLNILEEKYLDFANLYSRSEKVDYLKSIDGEVVMNELVNAIQNDPLIIDSNYNQKGIFVTFPSKDIFFPLLPTSVYGSKVVPATIRIIGHVSPKVFQEIKSFTKVEYNDGWFHVYDYKNLEEINDLKSFYSEILHDNKNIKYTKIEINSPSKYFTQDLWIKDKAPIKTYYSSFIANYTVLIAIFLFIFCSVLAGIVAGMIVFKDLRKHPIKLGFIGLSNCLTIIGLIITVLIINTKNENPDTVELIKEIKQKGYYTKRRVVKILFLLLTPFLMAGLPFLLLPFVILEIIYNNLSDVFWMTFIYLLLISILIIGFMIVRIKNEDKYLFEQLKSAKYSTFSFHPKDKMKLIFIPVFSISFLIFSWLLIKFIELTV
jgi:hypothetical protein